MTALRLATPVKALLDDVARLANGADPYLKWSQIEPMLLSPLRKLEKVATAVKSASGFVVGQAGIDDLTTLWTAHPLDTRTLRRHTPAGSRPIAERIPDAGIQAGKRH
jgi:hypothetical protein